MARCAICGENRKLTKEHVPPEKAFNNNPMLLRYLIQYEQNGQTHLKWHSSEGTFVKKTTCEGCNNKSGGWYGEAYVDFVKQMAHYADRCAVAKPADHPGMNIRILATLRIYPSRVAKQALHMFCATCGPDIADRYPEIRNRILDKRSQGRIADLRLWLYIRTTLGGHSTGHGVLYNEFTKRSFAVSEISFWPAGWVLTFKGEEMPKLWEATHWLNYGFDDKHSIVAALPYGTKITSMDWVGDLFRSPMSPKNIL